MPFTLFLFKIIDQIINFSYITIFLYLIMYFKKTNDEIEMEHINESFVNLCGINKFDGDTMSGIKSMYCSPDDTAFSNFTLTFKILYTSSYNLNLNILQFISELLNNTNGSMSPSNHKIALIIFYIIIFYLIKVTTLINGLFIKLFMVQPKKKKKKNSLNIHLANL